MRYVYAGAIFGLAFVALGSSARAKPAAPLEYTVSQGNILNAFYRAGPVAAHLVVRSGNDPRLVVAFPAGNSGVGVWFTHLAGPAAWTIKSRPRPVRLRDARGRPLYGIVAGLAVDAPRLSVKQAILSNIRVLRDYEYTDAVPAPVSAAAATSGDTIRWARDRLDGAAGYRLDLQVTDGTIANGVITAGPDGKIGLKVTAASGEVPLTPLAGGDLLNGRVINDPQARNTLTFLSYKEKFLAGSWHFDTYFGRDSLMSIRLLMPALQPPAVESGLRAVLARLSPLGEVAHEEDIGEFAILDHRKADGTLSDAPTFNYHMIDSNFMLAPVAEAWLVGDPRGEARAAAFLAAPDGRYGQAEEASGKALVLNLRFVVKSAEAFARDPRPANLIGLKDGMDAGQWRDSNDGLGKGRYPYDVNAVFVPAALEAADRLLKSGRLDPYLTAEDRAALAQAGRMAAVWRNSAPPLFDVSLANSEARADVSAYAASLGVSGARALASLGEGTEAFHALALNADGSPVRVVNSDEGFALLFADPSPEDLDMAVTAAMRPFPAGLMTDIGMLVANPAFAPAGIRGLFGKDAYHGTVVWSWQQALFAAGLNRQLERKDLPPAVRAHLEGARKTLWQAIDAARAVKTYELWSWVYKDGRYEVAPYGAGDSGAEADAAQLWSTVYLAIPAPK